MTVRVNEEFTFCRISKGRDQIVEISGSGEEQYFTLCKSKTKTFLNKIF